ncbi:hypothetical protein [Pseudomonas frederiksbergensis]|uniref:hypothetical protein n=1 Tax=Pseudomonas frederiksbergensis TaxID=104087 RepID=UPI003D1943D4
MLIRKNQSLDEILSPGKTSNISNDLFASTITRHVPTYDCFWPKYDDGIRLPLFVVANALEYETLFADISTFYQNLSPLSAYVYVCSAEISDQLLPERKKTPSSTKIDDKKLRLDIALILAEAVTSTFLTHKDLTTSNIGYSVCAQTLAASIARATTLYPRVSRSDISERWELARRLTNQEESGVAPRLGAQFSEKFSDKKESHSMVSQFLRGEISEDVLKEFFVSSFGLQIESLKIREVYNARISVFNAIVEKVCRVDESDEVKVACIAYFCNRILPGSMNHVASLKGYAEKYPDVVFWYMAFASLSSEFNYREAISGVCLKLARDILKPFSPESRPSCDISVDELSIISRVSMKASVLKPKGHRAVVVSLVPGVDVELSLGIPEAVKGVNFEAAEVNGIDSQKLKSLLFEAIDLLNNNGGARGRGGRYVGKNKDGGI